MSDVQFDGYFLPSAQEISESLSTEINEIDFVDKDSNLAFTGSNQTEEVDISFTLYKNGSGGTIKEQKSKLEEIVNTEVQSNPFRYLGKQGYISVESVDLPQSSSSRNIIEGSLSGKFFPWPQKFTSNKPSFTIPLSDELVFDLDLLSSPIIKSLINGNVNFNFTTAKNNLIVGILQNGNINADLDLLSSIGLIQNITSRSVFSLVFSNDENVYGSAEYGFGVYSRGHKPNLIVGYSFNKNNLSFVGSTVGNIYTLTVVNGSIDSELSIFSTSSRVTSLNRDLLFELNSQGSFGGSRSLESSSKFNLKLYDVSEDYNVGNYSSGSYGLINPELIAVTALEFSGADFILDLSNTFTTLGHIKGNVLSNLSVSSSFVVNTDLSSNVSSNFHISTTIQTKGNVSGSFDSVLESEATLDLLKAGSYGNETYGSDPYGTSLGIGDYGYGSYGSDDYGS